MNDPFPIQLALSFIVGAVWITVLTTLAERFGTKVGGSLAGLPATMVIALLFIGITQSAEIAAQTTLIVPFVVGVNAPYLGYRFTGK